MSKGQNDVSGAGVAGGNGNMMTMGNIGLARQTLFARITAGGKS
jgi:hypothetical protein